MIGLHRCAGQITWLGSMKCRLGNFARMLVQYRGNSCSRVEHSRSPLNIRRRIGQVAALSMSWLLRMTMTWPLFSTTLRRLASTIPAAASSRGQLPASTT
ncbi:hypothetical protein D9M73_296760 [compost metagenome]